MEGKFNFKYENADEYLKGILAWIDLLESWKEADEEFTRTYNIVPNAKELQVNVIVETTRESLPVV